MTMQSSIQVTDADLPIDADAAVETTIQGRSHGGGEVEEAANENWHEDENETEERNETHLNTTFSKILSFPGIIFLIVGLILSFYSIISTDFIVVPRGPYSKVAKKVGLFRHSCDGYCPEPEHPTRGIAEAGAIIALVCGCLGAIKRLPSMFIFASIMQLVPFLFYVDHPVCEDARCKIGFVGTTMMSASVCYACVAFAIEERSRNN